jgi:hypothetical protein
MRRPTHATRPSLRIAALFIAVSLCGVPCLQVPDNSLALIRPYSIQMGQFVFACAGKYSIRAGS